MKGIFSKRTIDEEIGKIKTETLEKKDIPRSKILIDEYEKEPTKEFEDLARIIAGTMIGTEPNFVIGIYGRWGTGKTTLMKAIQNMCTYENSKKEDIPTAWFNAWRFEREGARATIPLMLTIINRLGELFKEKQAQGKIDKKLRAKITDFLNGCEIHFGLNFEFVSLDITRPPDGTKSEDIIKPTTQLGLEIIEGLLKDMGEEFRMILFIDDLDRCAPEKALEVFESVKILLNLEGIIYVMGLDDDVADKLVSKRYKELGISGKDYIKKIIQIEIPVPVWEIKKIENMLEDSLLPSLKSTEYHDSIKSETSNIITVIKANPRELKRFINYFILAFEMFKIEKFRKITITAEIKKQYLISMLLRYSWQDIYRQLVTVEPEAEDLNKMIIELSKLESEDEYRGHIRKWKSEYVEGRKEPNIGQPPTPRPPEIPKPVPEPKPVYSRRLVELFEESDLVLYHFLHNIEAIEKIDWSLTKSQETFTKQEEGEEMKKKEVTGVDLLQNENVEQFNELRKKDESILMMPEVYLKQKRLAGINLSNANLTNANLIYADLSNADLSNADLTDANLTWANLTNANLFKAKLTRAILTDANFSKVDLSRTNLVGATISSPSQLGMSEKEVKERGIHHEEKLDLEEFRDKKFSKKEYKKRY